MSFDKSAENYLKSSDHAVGYDLDYVRKYLGDRRFSSALDVASAAGHFGKSFPMACGLPVTIDISPNMLKTARESMGLDKPVVSAAEFLPFKGESFDLVGCRIAMHHFRNPCMFMGEAFRVLKHGGLFILIDSVVGDEAECLNRIELIRDETHKKSFCVDDLLGLAEVEGFELEDIHVFEKCHNFREWAMRLNPDKERYDAIVDAFLELPERVKDELRLEIQSGEIISYTDKKGIFIFKK